MSQPIPVYEEVGGTFQADPCLPLIEGVKKGEVRLEALVRGHYPGRRLPRGALSGVKTVGFWDTHQDQDWGLDWHRNEGIEVTFLESGSLEFSVDNESHTLHPCDLTITRPWQRHQVGDPNVGVGLLHWLILFQY